MLDPQRRRCAASTLFAGVVLCLLSSQSVGDDWVGHLFLPRLGSTFYTEDRSRESRESPPLWWEVEEVDGDWCRIWRYWIRKQDLVSVRDAPSYYTERLRSGVFTDPHDRGLCYQCRGLAWKWLGEHKLAIADATEELALSDPNNGDALSGDYIGRPENYYGLHDTQHAMADLQAATAAWPKYSGGQILTAWILVTCPDPAIRNWKQAFEIMKKEVVSKPRDRAAFVVLAATYAEAGDFERAIEYQKKAIDRVDEMSWVALRRRYLRAAETGLALYKAGKPYRDEHWKLDPWYDFEAEKTLRGPVRNE